MLSILKKVKSIVPDRHPVRLAYHKLKAMCAAVVYGFPAHKLTVIGVTGTKGKTTTTNLIAHVLSHAGFKVGMTTSINFQIGDQKWVNTSKQTSLSPFDLQKMLRQMVKEGCTHAVIEVSSHAVTQNRIWGVPFDCAVLTQIDSDHIEYHGSHKAYRGEKLKLFRGVSRSRRKPGVQKVIVLNNDDQYFDEFKDAASDVLYTYGLKKGTFRADHIKLFPTGTEFVFKIPNHNERIVTSLIGEFNVYNVLAAASVAIAYGVSLHGIKDAFEDVQAIPGRQELIDAGQKFPVVVDYAHTVDSLTKVAGLFKPLTKGRLFMVYGCTGGGRDKSKRSEMGKVGDKYADVLILTDDDPYTEDRMGILNEISKWVERSEGPAEGEDKSFWKIPSRYEAIRLALALAREKDTVLILGKGCEEVMATSEGMVPWDDRDVVKRLLNRQIDLKLEDGTTTVGNRCFEG